MEDLKEKALSYHKKGFNCAQSVLAACLPHTGLDEKTALAVSGGFGGGVRCGEICGSVSGAVMAISLAFPYHTEGDNEGKDKIALLTKRCIKEFKEHFGALRCLELKGEKISCDELIAYAAELADRIIREQREADAAENA